MYCKYCGKIIESGDVFCSNCGAQLNAQTPRYPAPPQFPAPPQYPAHSQNPAGKAKTSLIFAIVAYALLFNVLGMGGLFGYGMRYVAALGFGVTSIVLGAIGGSKGYKYSRLSMWLGIGAVAVIFFTGIFSC